MKKVLIPAALILACGIAVAETEMTREFATVAAGQNFSLLDRNGDGAITREEASVVEDLDFDQADQNKDGILTEIELGAG